jgi:mRNA interferase RelE/StbE
MKRAIRENLKFNGRTPGLASSMWQLKSNLQTHEIINLKKLSGYKSAFRVRIGDYRIGVIIEKNTVTFVAFAHRKEIYNRFP